MSFVVEIIFGCLYFLKGILMVIIVLRFSFVGKLYEWFVWCMLFFVE